MSQISTSQAEGIGAHEWMTALEPYREPSPGRSVLEIAFTVGAFALCWIGMCLSLWVGYWLTLLLAAPAAGTLVRLFMIQHDCGHGSLFRSRRVNDWVGRLIAPLTLTPYDLWRHSHNIHHSGSGKLDRRGIGDIKTLTVREYRAMSPFQRLVYRLYRHPLVLFGLGPVFLFFIQHRLPVGFMRKGWMPWISTMATNLAIAVIAFAMVLGIGLTPFLLVHLPITLLAALIGVWLFYVQHQFEATAWWAGSTWQRHEAALYGSSYYALPGPLRWFTANIGVHDVHHLSSRIPFYRLQDVLRDHPHLANIGRVTVSKSFACVRLVLWDENGGRILSFRDVHSGIV